jgi:hypothetical protein
MRERLAVLMAGVLLAGATVVEAGLITPTNLDTLNTGTQVGNPLGTNFMTPDLTSQGGAASTSIGTVSGRVYVNNGIYTYTYDVDPSLNNPVEFNLGFSPLGFTGVAGYSFADAVLAGASSSSGSSLYAGNAFIVTQEDDGTIDYNVRVNPFTVTGFWNGATKSVPITFFYQSTVGPTNGDTFNLLASAGGSAENYAPGSPVAVPEPSSLLLLGAGLLGVGLVRGRRS